MTGDDEAVIVLQIEPSLSAVGVYERRIREGLCLIIMKWERGDLPAESSAAPLHTG